MLTSQHYSDDGANLRRYLRDLVALSALPAVWVGQSPQAIADNFAEALQRTLQLEFVYVRLNAMADSQPPIEAACTDSGAAHPAHVRDLASALEVPISYAGQTLGVVALGTPRDDLLQPQASEYERLLVQVGVNQLAIALATAQLRAGQVELAERQRANEELRRSEERFRALIDHSSDMVTLQDRGGTITYVSPSTSRLLGYAPTDLLGRSLLEAVHPDDRTSLEPRFADLVDQPGGIMTARYRIRHKSGAWRWIEATYTNLLEEPTVAAVVINRRDVSAEVEAQHLLEQRVVERTRELESLYQADETLYRSLRMDDVLQALVDVAADILRVDKSTVMALREPGERLAVRAARGVSRGALAGVTQVAEEGIVGEMIRTTEPFAVSDIRTDTRVSHRSIARLEADRVRALLSVPIIAGDGLFAIFTIYYTAAHDFTEEERRILQALAHRAALAIENARLYEAARGMAALEERQRLARELHDSVSQALYAIGLNAAAARQDRAADSARRDRLIGDVIGLAEAGLTEMRALIFELRPESLEQEGLVGALKKQVAAVQARYRLTVNATFSREPDVPLSTKEALYRVAQEALHNVAKHARAQALDLALEATSSELVLRVVDDGKGFDPKSSFPGHLGLRSMRERVGAVGGSLEIDSAPGKGTRICVRVPVSPD
jgi:PAS domain S-box-containing protein